MSTILIVGASRGIGLETVKAALDAGHTAKALARSAATIPLEHPRLQKIAGDARDRATVERALEGADVVIEVLGATFGPEAILKGTTLFSSATRTLVDAMRAKGPRRLIAVTGLGAGDSRGHGGLLYDAVIFPLLLKRVYDDKDVQEQIIKASGLDWTIVRPGLLTNASATGHPRALLNPAEWCAGSISRADVALFLVQEATEAAYLRMTPLLIA